MPRTLGHHLNGHICVLDPRAICKYSTHRCSEHWLGSCSVSAHAKGTGITYSGTQTSYNSAHSVLQTLVHGCCPMGACTSALVPPPLRVHPKTRPGAKRDSLGHNFPRGRKRYQEKPRTFAIKDPNSPHCCCGHLPQWLLRTPVIFANADLR